MLPIDELLKVLTRKLDDRFAGNVFQGGYCDHALAVASWSMPGQKEDLLGAYAKLLESCLVYTSGTGDSEAFSAAHSSGKKKVSEDETGRLPYQQTERVSERCV